MSERMRYKISIISDTGSLYGMSFDCNFDGKISFDQEDSELKNKILFVNSNGNCVVKTLNPIYINETNGNKVDSVELQHQLLTIICSPNHKYVLFVEVIDVEKVKFVNYRLTPPSTITIGRHPSCDICYDLPYITKVHASIAYNTKLIIRDEGSSNGVFLNGHKVKESELKLGDVITIMGLTLIVGSGFIAVSVFDGVKVESNNLCKIIMHKTSIKNNSESEDVFFNRNPRTRKSMKFDSISIEQPPMSLSDNSIPLVLKYGRTVVSGAGAIMSGNIMSAITSLIFPLFNGKYTEKQKKEYEEKRVKKYTEYLIEKERQIHDECKKEHEAIEWNYPSTDTILDFVNSKDRLWERKNIDDDFLKIRVGTGDIPMIADIDGPTERFTLEVDSLEEKMWDVVERQYKLENVGIHTSLVENKVIGISGDFNLRLVTVTQILLQICLLHSYDEVKIVFVGNANNLPTMNELYYLPHIWNDKKNFRFLATNPSEAYEISEYLHKELEDDLNHPKSLKEILSERPYYVLVALDKKSFDSIETIKEVLHMEKNIGVSVVAAFDNLPKECSMVFKLNRNNNHEMINLVDLECPVQRFKFDSISKSRANKAVSELSNTSLASVSEELSMPKSVSFLEMFGVGNIDNLNITKRWAESNPVASLAAPIGVAADRSLFTLDLHEKTQGPHGLVAGMTGSGKSEFILTYVLSMAVTYKPDEVAFILIDYKGGGLAGAFDDPQNGIHLPHVVGTITNLDGNTINRSLRSIQSEMLRRQEIFNQAKADNEEGTMDIYRYQQLYRAGKVKKAVPHLFIVSDEFAELKAQQPEFMDSLISIARIGRSLGVHLILATQKPSGVVNAQILSNTKFKVCLKVQDKSDSMEMINRPEAAELVDTGRFYLQVGYNEYFAMGQSAWSGAPYTNSDEVITNKDDSIRFLNATGQTVFTAKNTSNKTAGMKSQLVEIVKYLSEYALNNNCAAESLWTELLPEFIPCTNVQPLTDEEKTKMIVNVGLVDNPDKQTQFPLAINLLDGNHIVVGGESGCGKTVFLQTLLQQVSKNYSLKDVNYYIMDFSNRLLRPYAKDLHCGAWVDGENETNALDLLYLIKSIIADRKKLMDEENAVNFDQLRSKKKIPLILFVIDNYVKTGENKKLANALADLHLLLRDAQSVGVKFIISLINLNELPAKGRKEINYRIPLTLVDKYAYADFLNCRDAFVPAGNKGRGLIFIDGSPLEFQTYLPSTSSDIDIDYINNFIDSNNSKLNEDFKVRKLYDSSLDESQEFYEFCDAFAQKRLPIGYEIAGAKPVAIPFKQLSALTLYFSKGSSFTRIMNNLIYAIKHNDMDIIYVKSSNEALVEELLLPENCTFVEYGDEKYGKLVDLITNEILIPRRNIEKDFCSNNELDIKAKDIYKKVFDYMYDNSKPTIVIFENLYEFGSYLDKNQNGLLICEKLFEHSRELNLYFCGCLFEETSKNFTKCKIYSSFNPERLSLLFGSNVANFTYASIQQSENTSSINKGSLFYQKKLYKMLIPCGIIREMEDEEVADPDMENIFG